LNARLTDVVMSFRDQMRIYGINSGAGLAAKAKHLQNTIKLLSLRWLTSQASYQSLGAHLHRRVVASGKPAGAD
jgi:ABC-type proline/glycine betaine transport system substrate-binding protein